MLGYKVAKRQGEIAETQEKRLRQEMSRKADVVLKVIQKGASSNGKVQSAKFRLYARNIGDKTCTGFTWTILVPEKSPYKVTVEDAEELGVRTLRNEQYSQLQGIHEGNVYTHSVGIATITIDGLDDEKPEQVKLLYSVSHDDGRRPEKENTYAILTVKARSFTQFRERFYVVNVLVLLLSVVLAAACFPRL